MSQHDLKKNVINCRNPVMQRNRNVATANKNVDFEFLNLSTCLWIFMELIILPIIQKLKHGTAIFTFTEL